MLALSGKKVLIIIASQNFRDEEFKVPKDLLEAQGAKITVASSSLSEATGVLGLKVKPDILLDQAKVADYDAVVFVGGGGAREYFQSKQAHKIAQAAIKEGKILGAICIAPAILANAGVLTGKKATVFPSEKDALKNNGATYTGKAVERDGKIVTADGPQSAAEFGKLLISVLEETK